jgi:hypothetical protein
LGTSGRRVTAGLRRGRDEVPDARRQRCVDQPAGPVHIDTRRAAEEVTGQQKPAAGRGRERCRMHDDLRASHRLGDALAGAKIAPHPLDSGIPTNRPGKHPYPVAVPEDADKVSSQVTGSACREDGIHAENLPSCERSTPAPA